MTGDFTFINKNVLKPKIKGQFIGIAISLAILADFWLGQQSQKLKQKFFWGDSRGLFSAFFCSLWPQG